MSIRAIALSAAAGATIFAAPAMAADPGKYDATLTVVDFKVNVRHVFNVQADCVTGDYAGTGSASVGGAETIVGRLSPTVWTGRITGANAVTDFSLRWSRDYWKATRFVGAVVSEKATDC